MKDDEIRQICTGVLGMAGYIMHLESIVDRLPKTKDGIAFTVGAVVYCPRGHRHEIHPSDPMGGQIYCTSNGCWSDGCQSDSGCGAHYNAEKCTSLPPLTVPWATYCEIFPQDQGKIWVRFTGPDGIYRWLHPVEKRWVEEPDQIDMPMFPDFATARAAADISPEPPKWAEVVLHT